jgi:sulfite exporter TauE/SafE
LSGQVINFLSEAKSFFPWVSFVAGVGGSLHCVGMCGGLVTASCERSSEIFRYQIGRLLGYLLLGLLSGFLASYLDIKTVNPYFSLLPAILIGGLFIFWGWQNFLGKKAELPTPKFLSKFYVKLWSSLVQKNTNFTKAFFTGLISIFLPCGLLYGIVLGTVAFSHTYEALTSMFFFWLGTVPSMVMAPSVINRLIRPFKAKLPKTYAISLILIGMLTISFRMIKLHGRSDQVSTTQAQHKMSCH